MSITFIFITKKTTLFIIFFLFVMGNLFSQNKNKPAVESFESENILTVYNKTNGKLSISKEHFKFGTSSLKWEWQGESSFSTSNFRFLSQDESPLLYGKHFPSSPTLTFSIYNEVPQEGKVTITFGKKGIPEVWFDIPLSFKGWRHIWVPFYEMQGNKPLKGAVIDYDFFKVSSENSIGKLFFDDIIFSQYQDDRHQYPDMLVPFIKKDLEEGSDHWIPLISNYERIKNIVTKPISNADILDLKKFEKAIYFDLTIDKKYKIYMNNINDIYQNLGLKDDGKTITGPPLTFKAQEVYFDKSQQGANKVNDIQDLGKVLKRLATLYDRTDVNQKQEFEKMFINGTKYYLDQGWQAGTSGGTRHHIGYNVREITEAFYIMRNLLKENGLLNEVGSSLHWLFNLGLVLDDENKFHVNIDYLNTQSYYHLMLIFLMESEEKQVALISAYSNFISTTLAQQKELGGFKVDGSVWHHNGHYPAYGIGAFQTVPMVIKTLSGTKFRIQEKGHANFKKAFLASSNYSQIYDWGFANAGRHPLEENGISKLKKQFLLMAKSGNPEGTTQVDTEVGAAYLRLWGHEDVLSTTYFTNFIGIQKQKTLDYFTLPYAATAVHRRDNWAAIIKGYSKYVWASEIYIDENRYGRYPSNGTIQLLSDKGEGASGFKQQGWDWNRYPGATIVYLPFEQLETEMSLLMFRSNETFAGTTELNGNGIFGMILNESKGSNADGPESKVGFPGKLQAHKSVFSFGEKLICIGTNISSVDTKNPTQTNLFQSFLIDKKDPIYTSSETVTKFPSNVELVSNVKKENWLLDNYGNGYHIISNNAVQIKKDTQQSYDNRYSVRTGKLNANAKGVTKTEGDYASAWIDHGTAPNNASYQYVIYPFQKSDELKKFKNKVKGEDSYNIVRADSIAHIVIDNETNTTGYVVFAPNKKLEHGILQEVSEQSLVMIEKSNSKSLIISAVQPDLNFPESKKNNFKNYSSPVSLTLKIKGKWKTVEDNEFIKIENIDDLTTIKLQCKDGLPLIFKLVKN